MIDRNPPLYWKLPADRRVLPSSIKSKSVHWCCTCSGGRWVAVSRSPFYAGGASEPVATSTSTAQFDTHTPALHASLGGWNHDCTAVDCLSPGEYMDSRHLWQEFKAKTSAAIVAVFCKAIDERMHLAKGLGILHPTVKSHYCDAWFHSSLLNLF